MVTAQLAALAVFWAAISVLRVWPPQWLRRSLQKGSIELAPARLTLNTVALNPALHRVAGATSARRREFWKQWYNAGVHVFFVLLVFVTAFLAWNLRASVGIILRGVGSASQEPGAGGGSVVLTPLVPGVNTPLADAPLLWLAVLLAVVVHEAGHAVAAIAERVRVFCVGFFVAVVVPGAFVRVDQHVHMLSTRQQLRVYCAGVWNNVVLCLAALIALLLLPLCLSVVFAPSAPTLGGVLVSAVPAASPFLGLLRPGDVVGSVHGQPTPSLAAWTMVLQDAHASAHDPRAVEILLGDGMMGVDAASAAGLAVGLPPALHAHPVGPHVDPPAAQLPTEPPHLPPLLEADAYADTDAEPLHIEGAEGAGGSMHDAHPHGTLRAGSADGVLLGGAPGAPGAARDVPGSGGPHALGVGFCVDLERVASELADEHEAPLGWGDVAEAAVGGGARQRPDELAGTDVGADAGASQDADAAASDATVRGVELGVGRAAAVVAPPEGGGEGPEAAPAGGGARRQRVLRRSAPAAAARVVEAEAELEGLGLEDEHRLRQAHAAAAAAVPPLDMGGVVLRRRLLRAAAAVIGVEARGEVDEGVAGGAAEQPGAPTPGAGATTDAAWEAVWRFSASLPSRMHPAQCCPLHVVPAAQLQEWRSRALAAGAANETAHSLDTQCVALSTAWGLPSNVGANGTPQPPPALACLPSSLLSHAPPGCTDVGQCAAARDAAGAAIDVWLRASRTAGLPSPGARRPAVRGGSLCARPVLPGGVSLLQVRLSNGTTLLYHGSAEALVAAVGLVEWRLREWARWAVGGAYAVPDGARSGAAAAAVAAPEVGVATSTGGAASAHTLRVSRRVGEVPDAPPPRAPSEPALSALHAALLHAPSATYSFLWYLLCVSASVAMLNTVPCYALDGEHAVTQLLRAALGTRKLATLVIAGVLRLGTLLLVCNVIVAFLLVFV